MASSKKSQRNKSSQAGFEVYSDPIIIEAERPKVFTCSTDRAEKVLLRYSSALSAKGGWVAPFSLCLALITSLLTSNFKDFAGLSGGLWGGAFIVGAITSFIWTVNASYKAFIGRNTNAEDIVKKLYSDEQ